MLEFKTYTMLDGGTCGAIMPPADESQCDWVITAVWPQVSAHLLVKLATLFPKGAQEILYKFDGHGPVPVP